MKQLPFFLLTLYLSCAPKTTYETCELLIKEVSIVDAQEDRLIPNQWVAVDSGRIIATGDMEKLTYRSANEIEGAGRYLSPGLWDNHVHFRGGDGLIQENKALLVHFLSHGITTVRDAGGDITPAVKDWQEAINNEKMTGPTIFTSGPKIDGARPAWAGSLSVTSKEDVDWALDSLQAIGVQYVKTYDGSLSAAQYYQVIEEAERRGLKVTGHMPLSARFMQAVELGLDGTEHMYYLLKACSPVEDSLTALGKGYGMMADLLATYDEALADSVFSVLAARDFYVTPTLYIGKVLSGLAKDGHAGDSLLQYMGPGIQKTYEGRVRTAKRNTSSLSKSRAALGERFRSMIPPLFESGTNVLAGSDCGPFNSFVYPGQSLHGELQELVNTGLTPAQALTCSYVNGPRFMDMMDDYGSVAPGKRADLILLRSNPLSDIRNLRTVETVIKNGQIISY